MSINVFTASGHIGNDMELRYTGNGKCIGNFRLPVKSGFGEREKTTWITCRVLGERAEKLAPYMKKGCLVTATGEFFMEEWVADGVKHAYPCLLVANIQLSPRQATANTMTPPPQSQNEPPFYDDDIPF